MPLWSFSKPSTTSLDEEESASLTRNASPWSRNLSIEALDPEDDDRPAEKATTIRRRGPVPELRRWRVPKLFALMLAFLALALGGGIYLTSYGRSSDSNDQGRPWKKFGTPDVVNLGVHAGTLPICERTMLIEWRSFQYGFGSTATTILQAGIVAKMHGYTMLFDRGANKYGRYLDFFDAVPLNCYAPEELYDPAHYSKLKEAGLASNVGAVINDQFDRPGVDRLLVGTDDIHPLNHHITALVYPDMALLDSLPDLDASKPVPVSSSIPQVFAESFDRYSALTAEHFRLNGLLRAKLNGDLSRLTLAASSRDVPTIGVHWRGGDKLERECVGSSQLSCGNVTHHCVTAWDSLPETYLRSSTPAQSKPRLLLMTTEPNALDLFHADSVCQRFDIQLLEDSQEKKSFQQDQWNALSDVERAADAQGMFVGAEILANHVDAAVVSPNSNLARIIMTLAGPRRVKQEGAVRSVDIYWHPVHYPPFKRAPNWGGCDGTWGGCWPHD